MSASKTTKPDNNMEYCFAIMPISDVDTHPKGHFQHVYQDIITPACEKSGFRACRADEVKAANLIQLDILKNLIDAPIAICDLSTRNPNVLFELGIRQAFDKPVVLIQEIGTPPIFDISGLRYLQYSKDMKYHEVLKTQNELSNAINETLGVNQQDNNINSIVKLLALSSPAQIPDLKGNQDSLAFDVIQTEMRSLRRQMDNLIQTIRIQENPDPLINGITNEEELIKRKFLRLENEFLRLSRSNIDNEERSNKLRNILKRLELLQSDINHISPPWEELPQEIDSFKNLMLQQIDKNTYNLLNQIKNKS